MLPIKSVSFEALIAKRQAIIEKADQMMQLNDEIEQIQASMSERTTSVIHGSGRGNSVLFMVADKRLAKVTARVDKLAWQKLLDESGLKTMMSRSMLEQWDKIFYDDTAPVPELTLDSVKSTFEQLAANRGDMMIDSVVELFQKLSWSYKSNLPHKLGKRIVMTHMGAYSRCVDQLADLERVVNALKGLDLQQPELASMYYNARLKRSSGEIETDDFRIKFYANHNAHVFIKDPVIIENLNALIAKRYPDALPPVK